MTRGRRLGQLAAAPGAGPSKGRGPSPSVLPTPTPGFFLTTIEARGQVCLTCGRRIVGDGEQIRYATMTTHAHLGCAPAALKLLA